MHSLSTFVHAWPGRRLTIGRRAAGCLGVLALALTAACAEELEGGAGCPSLCPVTNEAVRDTVLTPVVLDTALANVPVAGDPTSLLLALRPGADSLDVRAVFRFDSLPARFAPPAGGDSVAITTVQGSALRLLVDTASTIFGAARARVPAVPLTLEAYDVDTTVGADTTPAALAALFRPARRLGALTLPAGQALPAAELRIPISDSAVAARVGRRLRVGVRVVSAEPVQFRVFGGRASGVLGPAAPSLRFDPASDTTTRELTVPLNSTTPAEPSVADAYIDQTVVAATPQAPPATDLVVGGLPARRTFLRFVVPARFLDSVSVVRATLELVQRPAPGAEALDSVTLVPLGVLATDAVDNLVRASEISAPVGIAPVRLSPAGSGVREIPLVRLLTFWQTGALPATTQRALVLRAQAEGVQAGELRFHSTEATAGLRPRLRLSYIPRTNFGLP
jgi:hypothetical protein